MVGDFAADIHQEAALERLLVKLEVDSVALTARYVAGETGLDEGRARAWLLAMAMDGSLKVRAIWRVVLAADDGSRRALLAENDVRAEAGWRVVTREIFAVCSLHMKAQLRDLCYMFE